MKLRLLLVLVLLCPLSAFAQSGTPAGAYSPGGGGLPTPSSSATSTCQQLLAANTAASAVWGIPFNQYDPCTYGAYGDAKVAADVHTDGTTGTITCADCGFVSTDVGKLAWVIAGSCNGGSIVIGNASTVPTITAYISATSVTLSMNSNSVVTTGCMIWGHDDTAALNSMWTAVITPSICGSIQFHASGYIISGPVMITTPACDSATEYELGVVMYGKGAQNTFFFPTATFNFAGCVTTCFGPPAGYSAYGFQVFGGGYNGSAPAYGNFWMELDTPGTFQDIWLNRYFGTYGGGAATAIVVGTGITIGYQVYVDAFLSNAVKMNGTYSTLYQLFAADQGLGILAAGGNTGSPYPTCYSCDISALSTSAGSVQVTGYLALVNTELGGAPALVSGGHLQIKDSNLTPTGSAFAITVNSSGTLDLGGGNVIGNTGSNASVSGDGTGTITAVGKNTYTGTIGGVAYSNLSASTQCGNTSAPAPITGVATKTYFAANCLVPANSIAPGANISVSADGIFTMNGVGDTLTFFISLCTVSGCGSGTVVNVLAPAAVTPGVTTANERWHIDGTLLDYTVGATGTISAQGNLEYGNTALFAEGVLGIPNSSTSTVSTTVNEYVSVAVTPSVTTDTLTLKNLIVKVQ